MSRPASIPCCSPALCPSHFYSIESRASLSLFRIFLLSVALAVSAAFSEEKTLQGEGRSGDWRSDAPGVRHHGTLSDLPAVFATESVSNPPKVVKPVDGTTPKVPAGFASNNPLASPFIPPGPNPEFVYVANTGGIVRMPYRLGDMTARGKPVRCN